MSFAALGSRIIDREVIPNVCTVRRRRGSANVLASCVNCKQRLIRLGQSSKCKSSKVQRLGCAPCGVVVMTYRKLIPKIDKITENAAIELFRKGRSITWVQMFTGINSRGTAVQLRREALDLRPLGHSQGVS